MPAGGAAGKLKASERWADSAALLQELKLANQHIAFSQQAEMAIAEALDGNSTLTRLTIELRSSRARELRHVPPRRAASAWLSSARASALAALSPRSLTFLSLR